MKKLFTLLTFMVVSIATYGYTDLVTSGYTPGTGNTFSKTVSITSWDTQAIVASINVSKCTSKQNNSGNDINEEILAIGNVIDKYSGAYNGGAETDVIHFYFHHNTSGEGGTLEVVYFYGTGENSKICAKKSVESNELLIRFNKTEGVIVNGVSFNHKPKGTGWPDAYTQGDSITSDISSYYSEILALSSVLVGSAESANNATYNYIRVLDKTAAFGTDAAKSTNWNYQEFVASINVSGCSNWKNSAGNDVNDEILAIGNVIGKYSAYYNSGNETDVIHFYFHHNAAGEGGQLEVIYFYGTQDKTKVRAKKNVDSDNLLIKFSKGFGVTVNGESFNFESSNTYNTGDSITGDVSSYYSEILALENTYIGCPEGCYATYNSVELKSLMTLDESANNAEMISHFNNNTAVSTALKRTLTVNEWNTFCVPFDIPSGNALLNSSFCTVKEFDKVEGTTMYLKTATEMKAGKPYLVKPTVAISNPRFENVTVAATSPSEVGSDTYKFVGLYSTKEFSSEETSTSYILVSGGNLVNPTASTMKGMRAYFTCTGKAGVAPRVDIDGVETALSEVVGSEEITDGRIYNLRGMYVGNDSSRLAKGIYIKNGKKVVLK